ncbi:MAG: ribosome-binding factor A [Pirellulales bacterium]|nr:ribosome-binding factor A [Pirellulales bacterium]
MSQDKRARKQMLAHCGSIHEDDGIDPREFFKTDRSSRKDNRKALQLCRQVAETLEQVFSGETGDEVVAGLHVSSVVPTPDSSRLLVTLVAACDDEQFDLRAVEKKLADSRGRLRSAVAMTITRRKTPVLAFEVIGPESAAQRPESEGQS